MEKINHKSQKINGLAAFGFILAIALSSCLKVEEASEIPEIKLKELEYTLGYDTTKLQSLLYKMELTISFIDGDGDIGSADSTKQLFVTPMRKVNKEIDDTLETLSFIIPYIEPIKSVRTMNGEIKCDFYASRLNGYKDIDTIIYETYIIDRAGHESNIIQTENFYYNLNPTEENQ